MDAVGLTFTVSTSREHEPVTGGDSTIFKMPPEFYVDLGDGHPGLATSQFVGYLEGVAEAEAANVGEVLHHAHFVITSDPHLVRRLGLLHDCPECQDSISQTMALMASDPDQQMVVGQVFWAGPR